MSIMKSREASSSTSPFCYHVFLSFSGKDTRKAFTDHLYTALDRAGFRTFRDDDGLERGEDIKSELEKAIRESRMSIIVFSKSYASSIWCLDELVMILKRRTCGHVVLPVFYDVDPSEVRKQNGCFEEAFARHELNLKSETEEGKEELKNKVGAWRAALRDVANLAGMNLKNEADGHEARFIQKIIEVVGDKVSRATLDIAPHVVGIDSQVETKEPFDIHINLRITDHISSSKMLSLADERDKMAKKNVVITDTKSGMAISVAVSNSSTALFTTEAQKPPVAPGSGSYINISRKKLLQNLEINGTAARINARMQHPSALEMFQQITSASKGKQIGMFLDYDGTLSPIVDDPDRAFMSNSMRAAVRELARYFPTAIVSGGRRDKVYSFVQLAELYYAGSHGTDIKGPSKGAQYKDDAQNVLRCQPASEFVPMINEVYNALLEKTKSTPGAKVEDNKFCISVHFRHVDEKRWSELAQQVRSVLKEYPKLRLTHGRKVLEIRPTIKWDKGKALEFLLECSLGFANCTDVFPIYIGDDRTDEDAFKVLRDRGQGFGILVSNIPKETNASYYLQEPSEVLDFLQRLVQWKRLSLRLEELKVSPIEKCLALE